MYLEARSLIPLILFLEQPSRFTNQERSPMEALFVRGEGGGRSLPRQCLSCHRCGGTRSHVPPWLAGHSSNIDIHFCSFPPKFPTGTLFFCF